MAAGSRPENLVERAHRCKDCGHEQCITEHLLGGIPGLISHYQCECCGEIYDTISRVPWQ